MPNAVNGEKLIAAGAGPCDFPTTRLIDVAAALAALRRCAAQPACATPASPDGPPGTLLAATLASLGVGAEDFRSSELGPKRRAAAPSRRGRSASFTLGAVIALRAADHAERAAAAWDRCVEAAERAVARYVDLMPATVLRNAHEPPRR